MQERRRPLKITRIEIRRWRNIESIIIKPGTDTNLVCLTGENGTGKSAVLELISQLLSHMGSHGQAEQPPRGNPLEEPHDIELELDLSDQRDEIDRYRRSALQGLPAGISSIISREAGETVITQIANSP